MKKATIWIFLIIILYVSSSCIAFERSFKPSGFTYKYDGKYTGLDTLIFLDGYYKSTGWQTRLQPGDPLREPYHTALMFYRDGLVCSGRSEIFRDRSRPVHAWGTYRVYGDTIKCQFISDNGVMGGVDVTFRIYRIISKNEIVEYRSTFVDRENVIIIHPVNLPKGTIVKQGIIENLHSFYPLENRIDSTEWNWLLNKKWFWDADAYRNRNKK